MPQSVDRPQWVLRSSDNPLNIRGTGLLRRRPQAQPLALILATAMMQDLDGASVVVRTTDLEESAWKLGIDIQHFEAKPSQTTETVWALKH